MSKVSYYSNEEIKEMKKLLKSADGQTINKIATLNHKKFKRPFPGFCVKLHQLSKDRSFGAKKAWITRRRNILQSPAKETALPKGFTFDGTPKKVTFCLDHFRVYF